jgi:rRNA maturation endonuclease Nob1
MLILLALLHVLVVHVRLTFKGTHMKYRIICGQCEVESVVHLIYDEPPNHCPYCGSELSDDEIDEYESGCLCD